MYFKICLLFLCGVLVINANAQTKPYNIVFMMSDDHSYKAISAYGYGINHTPNIDAMAKEGMLFKNAFVTNSICGPSRAVMLTGKYSHINGYKDNIHSTFNETQTNVATLLQKAGYQTAIIGKYHLGSHPSGFDYWNIVPGQGDYYNPDFIENGVKSQRKGYVTTLTMDYALEWLKNRDVNKPFFLICNQKAPHRNWMPETKYLYLFSDTEFQTPKTFYDPYLGRRAAAENKMSIAKDMNWAYDLKLSLDTVQNAKGLESYWNAIFNRMNAEEKAEWQKAYLPVVNAFKHAGLKGKKLAEYKLRRYLQDYLRCIQSVDDQVGRLNAFLKKNDLDQNTIVIYTSDQGFYMGEHGWFDKRWMYDESFKTPLIIKWPGVTKSKSSNEDMVMNLDFAETILDMAGQPIPADMQGKSMVPLLKSEQKIPFRDAVYYHYYESGDEHNVAKHIGVRTQKYKLIYFYELKDWELYDLKKDPNEMKNVFKNTSYQKIGNNLRIKLKALQKTYQDPEPNLENTNE